MINYLVFPGITDQKEEMEALRKLIQKTEVNFIHMKNLCIDPELYINAMPSQDSPAMGMRRMLNQLEGEFPRLELGYFNQPVR